MFKKSKNFCLVAASLLAIIPFFTSASSVYAASINNDLLFVDAKYENELFNKLQSLTVDDCIKLLEDAGYNPDEI